MSAMLVRNGRIFDPGQGIDREADLLVRDGAVVQIAPGIEEPGAEAIDAAGYLVIPGLVDLHAHLREPGFEHKGTIATETAAAAEGGFTTVCAMPNTDPPPDSAPNVESILDRARTQALIRVLPVGCVTRDRHGRALADLSELVAAGCVALSDDGDPVADATILRRALEFSAAAGIPISEHAIDPAIAAGGVMNEGRISERLGLPGEPAAAEVAAIARAISLAETTSGRLHIAHVTAARSVELIAGAKAAGLPITAEVTPSHLFLTEDAVFGPGPEPLYDSNARINPPLRTEPDRLALLAGLASGTIDAIATDHAPHAIEDKLCEFEDAAPGISCFETALATVLTLVDRGDLALDRAIEALTTAPTRAFALGARVPGLGAITEGGLADLAIVDPAERWTVDTAAFRSMGHNTPLHRVELTGKVRATIAAGRLVHSREGVPA